MELQALIFDADGTLADTEIAHLQAFNKAFADSALEWTWDRDLYAELLEISGGKERMLHYWRHSESARMDISGTGIQDTIDAVHDRKAAYYDAMVHEGAVRLRPGVIELIHEAHAAGLRLCVVTSTSPVIVSSLLQSAIGPLWRYVFQFVLDGSVGVRRKPDPQLYSEALSRLQLPAENCLVMEDSAKGVRAATSAGIRTIATPTPFTINHDFSDAMIRLESLEGIKLHDLKRWFRECPSPNGGKGDARAPFGAASRERTPLAASPAS